MPTINVRADDREVAAHPTLTAGGEPTRVVFDSTTVYAVELINRGTGPVWFTVNGATPAVAGRGSFYLQPGATDVRRTGRGVAEETVVSLLAEASTAVSVQRVH